MKHMRPLAMLLAAIVLLCAVTPVSLAAGDVSVGAGETASLAFSFSNIFSMDGVFAVEDTDGIVQDYTISVTDTQSVSVSVNGDRVWAVPNDTPEMTTVIVTVRVQIAGNAAAGKSCTVYFSGISSDSEAALEDGQPTYQSAAIRVKEPAAAKPAVVDHSTLKAAVAKAEALQENTYTEASWAALSTALEHGRSAMNNKEQKQVNAAADALSKAIADLVKIDRSRLEQAIENAAESLETLQKSEYTAASWQALSTALDSGRDAVSSREQKQIDAAADTLERAAAGLQEIDRSKVEQAIAQVQRYQKSDALAAQWAQLNDAISVAKALWNSGDQAALDTAADQITAALEQISAQTQALRAAAEEESQTPAEPAEPVEQTEPKPSCTITAHRVWPVLFAVSAAGNVALVIVIVLQKKKRVTDDTPLVDYDISDDLL